MSEEKKFETLEEILECVKPKNVFAIIEVSQNQFKLEGNDVYTKPLDLIDHATRCMEIIERIKAVDDKVTIRNSAAYLQPTPEGHAKLLNHYIFIDAPGALHDISLSDLTFVYRLDGKCEITHFPSKGDENSPILPHHVVV